jgi:hypothetical protein
MNLIVARYTENLNWISSIESNFSHIYIYNKENSIETKYQYKELPNIGREANTYIYHIIDQYESISDFTIFLQGNPYDHCPTLNYEIQHIERLRKIKKINFFEISFNPDFYEFGDWLQVNTAHEELYHCLDLICDITKIQKFNFKFLKKNIWGAQFGVSDKLIKKYTKKQWKQLLKLSETIDEFPYAMEKFWSYIFR